ncbi:hypothetical protein ACWGOQ_0015000 [Aquimarina sp. M1]
MKRKAKIYAYRYKFFLVGVMAAVIGYIYSSLTSWDISWYLAFTEKYQLNQTLCVWIVVFLFFITLNFISIQIRRKESQKRKKYKSMLYSSNQIIKSLLYQIKIIKMEADKTPTFDQQVIRMFDSSVEEAKELVVKLGDINHIDHIRIVNPISSVEKKEDNNIYTPVLK